MAGVSVCYLCVPKGQKRPLFPLNASCRILGNEDPTVPLFHRKTLNPRERKVFGTLLKGWCRACARPILRRSHLAGTAGSLGQLGSISWGDCSVGCVWITPSLIQRLPLAMRHPNCVLAHESPLQADFIVFPKGAPLGDVQTFP